MRGGADPQTAISGSECNLQGVRKEAATKPRSIKAKEGRQQEPCSRREKGNCPGNITQGAGDVPVAPFGQSQRGTEGEGVVDL